MSIDLPGLDGGNPLGFLASCGILRITRSLGGRLSFATDGSNRARLALNGDASSLCEVVARDAAMSKDLPSLQLAYSKEGKAGSVRARDLKAPPLVFRDLLLAAKAVWARKQDGSMAQDVASFGTSEERDGKGNTKPTAFHFTAANQQFLQVVDESRSAMTLDLVTAALLEGNGRRCGSNLRWDPKDDRSHALMAADPSTSGTMVDSTLEWLAFRGLAAFPVLSVGRRTPATTGVSGRGDEMRFAWPLWAYEVDWATARSLVCLPLDGRLRARGVFAIAASEIRRTSQGFGNFGPAAISAI